MIDIRSPLREHRRLLLTLCAVPAIAILALQQGPAHAQSPTAADASKRPASASRPAMDLHAPPLNHVYPRKELRALETPDDANTVQAAEVTVKSARYVRPVPGGPGNQFVAIPWAILHPTQAWRIFTPVEQQP